MTIDSFTIFWLKYEANYVYIWLLLKGHVSARFVNFRFNYMENIVKEISANERP